jgi:hypothetical protein
VTPAAVSMTAVERGATQSPRRSGSANVLMMEST